MQQDLPRHEKIRFRRNEITDLASLPSAVETAKPAKRRRQPRRLLRILGGVVGGVLVLLVLAVAALHAVGLSGVGSDRMREAAETALRDMAGVDAVVSMGPSRITLDGMRFLALEVQDVSFRRRDDDAEMMRAGSVRFGARLMPLLSGEVKVSSVGLSDARIVASALGGGIQHDWTKTLRNERGLIDPDLVANAVFGTVHHMLDAIGYRALQRIGLDNVELVLPTGEGELDVRVVRSRLTESLGDSLTLASDLEIGSRPVSLSLSAVRDRSSRLISAIDLTASSAETAPAAGSSRLGSLDLKMTGAEGSGASRSRIEASLKVADWAVDLGARGAVGGDIDFDGRVLVGNNRVDVGRLSATVGRSQFNFVGVLGPRPSIPGEEEGEAAYRFDLASARSTIAPEGSPEPAMNVGLRLGGIYLPEARALSADQIVVKSGRAEALGTATLHVAEGKTPGLLVAFNVHDMPVSQVKQLWPWFSARPARNWVLNNVFGGSVTEGQLKVEVPPGRLGDGIPLTAEESFGTFKLERTRFDTTGVLPPVRDATGVVNYRGNDVDIALSSGTVYLPSGRTVEASDGMLRIRKGNVPPVIGALDIDVAGDAPAVAEFASYDPINAMQYMGLTPEDFTSGQLSGNVKADIPLQKGVDRDRLGWLVALDYKDLAIAKQIDGQSITDADGTIVVDKTRAEVKADAKLNGVQARLDIVEPLGGSTVDRKRLVTVTLDEKTRETVVPGLTGLVEGPVKVVVDARGGGERRIEADLTMAKLNLPWVGWSKGSGVGGSVSFLMETDGGRTTLSDFDLRGDTFGIGGQIVLANGGLSEARLSKVRLNRNDDVAVTVKRSSGENYTVDVTGNSLDARSVIKRFMSDSETSTKAAPGGTISVNADVGAVAGFHNESLRNVKLQYRGSSAQTDRLDVTANAASGSAIEFSNGIAGASRAMRMTSADAGAVLRFLDLYEYMQGGKISLDLKGGTQGAMNGPVDVRDFVIVDDPRLRSLVSTTPPGGDRSLNQAVRREIDTSRVHFERCYSQVEKGTGYLRLSNGILRGTLVGASFQGMLYDQKGNMDMTGTFMPAYGLNRLFGEIPIIGVLLGNGRDRGLIGVTFKLEGDADAPDVQINPLSVVAPGIFRSIFEFR